MKRRYSGIIKSCSPDTDYDVRPEPLASGTYGNVHFGRDLKTKDRVVVKKFRHTGDNVSEDIIQEIGSLVMLEHPNILKVTKIYLTPESVALVTPYYENTVESIKKMYRDQGSYIPESTIKDWMRGLLGAVEYLHNHGYIHRDIKPANILLNSDNQPILIDFGLAKYVGVPGIPLEMEVQTLWYRAPEVLYVANNKSKKYSYPADIWSVGCIAGELYGGSVLFPAVGELDLTEMHTNMNKKPNKVGSIISRVLPSEVLDLINNLLCLIPEDRFTATQALSQPYFDNKQGPKSALAGNYEITRNNQAVLQTNVEQLCGSPNIIYIAYYEDLLKYADDSNTETILLAYNIFNYMIPFITQPMYVAYLRAALWIATKIYEVTFPDLPDDIQDSVYKAERHILLQTQFLLHVPSVYSLVRGHIMSEASTDDFDTKNKMAGFLSIFTMFNGLWRYPQTVLARGIYYITNYITTGTLPEKAADSTIVNCVRDLIFTIEDNIVGDSPLADYSRKHHQKMVTLVKTNAMRLQSLAKRITP